MDPVLFRQILFFSCRVDQDNRIVVGVSGGPDSIALLDLLNQCNVNVIAAHFNHQLRGQAQSDLEFVRSFCRERKIRFTSGKANIRELAQRNKRSIEEQARISRYQFLFQTAKKENAVFVAVGHNADDQVETVLMHLLRGSGLSGLCGMEMRSENSGWSDGIVLIRPLLDTWRSEIDDYCKQRNLNPIQDLSNQESLYYRNRIRNELVPYLATYNPAVKGLLTRLANVLKGDKEILQVAVEQALTSVVSKQNADHFILDRSRFRELKFGMQREVLRFCIHKLYPDQRDLDFEIIEHTRDFAQQNREGIHYLFRDLHIESENESIILTRSDTKLDLNKYPQIDGQIQIGAQFQDNQLGDNWRLEFSLEKKPKILDFGKLDPNTAIIDSDKLSLPLFFGTSQPGERFLPLGMTGHSIKVSDYWINKKLPKKYRAGYPLLYDQNKIVWIPGFQPSETVRVDAATRTILRISLIKPG